MEPIQPKPALSFFQFKGVQLLNLVTAPELPARPAVARHVPKPLGIESVLPPHKAGKRNTLLAALTHNTDVEPAARPRLPNRSRSRPSTRNASQPARVQPSSQLELKAWLEARKRAVDQIFTSAMSEFGIDASELFGEDAVEDSENVFD